MTHPETPSLDISDAAAAAVQRSDDRVTLELVKQRVAELEFIHPESIPHMTIAVLLLDNGYAVIGKSTPADPENFDPNLGKQFAYEDAVRQVWPLEAYLLRERLSL